MGLDDRPCPTRSGTITRAVAIEPRRERLHGPGRAGEPVQDHHRRARPLRLHVDESVAGVNRRLRFHHPRSPIAAETAAVTARC